MTVIEPLAGFVFSISAKLVSAMLDSCISTSRYQKSFPLNWKLLLPFGHHQWTSRKIKSYCSELTNICVDIVQLRQRGVYLELWIYWEVLWFLLPSNNYDGEGNGTPLQYSCLKNPMDGGAWWAAVRGVSKSRARLSDFTFTFHFHALEKEMATHSSVLAWRIPGTEEPSGLPSMGLHRVGHD